MIEKIVVFIIVTGAVLLVLKKLKKTLTKDNQGCSGCNGCCPQQKDNKETCGVIIENRYK